MGNLGRGPQCVGERTGVWHYGLGLLITLQLRALAGPSVGGHFLAGSLSRPGEKPRNLAKLAEIQITVYALSYKL